MTLIKICGITNLDDALAAARLGADYLGFIFAESPRRVEPEVVAGIVRDVHASALAVSPKQLSLRAACNRSNGNVKTVGVVTEESDDILSAIDQCGLDYVQLHGGQSEEFAARIGAERVIRVARVKDEASVDALAQYHSCAFYLLDTYKKGVAGGTGETFDWALAAHAKLLSKPVILSGGLGPENAGEAVVRVRPYALDVSSGVESSPGIKDYGKIEELINNVRQADSIS